MSNQPGTKNPPEPQVIKPTASGPTVIGPQPTSPASEQTTTGSGSNSSVNSSAKFFRPPTILRRHPLRAVGGLLALLVVVLALGWSLGTSKPKAVSAANTAEVSISSAGFSPKTIQIKAGQSVNFTNNDTAAHWVASDPYPKDDALPGFNSAALQPKDSYAYPFTKPGTYTYHDNLNPFKLQGTVVVR